jgi:hypothetical protein
MANIFPIDLEMPFIYYNHDFLQNYFGCLCKDKLLLGVNDRIKPLNYNSINISVRYLRLTQLKINYNLFKTHKPTIPIISLFMRSKRFHQYNSILCFFLPKYSAIAKMYFFLSDFRSLIEKKEYFTGTVF